MLMIQFNNIFFNKQAETVFFSFAIIFILVDVKEKKLDQLPQKIKQMP